MKYIYSEFKEIPLENFKKFKEKIIKEIKHEKKLFEIFNKLLKLFKFS